MTPAGQLRVFVALVLLGPMAMSAGESWDVALPGYVYQFPRDHFAHPRYQTEWWYYTGNLKAADGHRFGFELTFFRQGISRTAHSRDTKSPWQVDDIYLAHLALSDLDAARFYHTERLNRAGPGLAGADFAARRIWNGNWEVRFDEATASPTGVTQPVQRLQAVCDDFTLRLTLASLKPPVIHGLGGISQKAAGRGQASHYISYTRLDAGGTLTLAGHSLDLSGLAWMDHEFFTHQLTPDQTGWDWFSIQLSSGDELMLYRLRRRDGSADPFSAGTYVDVRGTSRHLTAADFSLQPGAAWTSPATGAQYQLAWTIRVPSLGLALSVSTSLDTQELVSRSAWPNYWEGAVAFRGARSTQSVSGVGYLEMTGYDRPVEFPQ
jgi:predicted secreted hydrolase